MHVKEAVVKDLELCIGVIMSGREKGRNQHAMRCTDIGS